MSSPGPGIHMTSRLAQFARSEVDARRFAGVSWLVEHKGTVVERDATGHADHALSRPLTTDAIVRIYSMTKPVVSMLALMLVDEGRLSLSDPVSGFFERFGAAGVLRPDGSIEPVVKVPTVEHLMMHTAGLSYDFLPDCPVAQRYREAGFLADGSRSLDDLALGLADMPLARQPGEQWYYSYGTDMLAAIVQRVMGMPLREGLRTRVLDPLGMSDTHFGVQESSRHRLADVFGARSLEIASVATDDTPQTLEPMDVEESCPSTHPESFARGGLGLCSTLDDYAAFMRFLHSGCGPDGSRLISAEMLDSAWQNRLTDSQRPICIWDRAFPGYGWGLFGRVMVDTNAAGAHASAGEGGWSGAASTWFWVDRRNHFSGVVFSQYLASQVHLGEHMQAAAYAEYRPTDAMAPA